ncbi:MAG: hypothetical protein ACFFD4_17505 [Candidatus Odinarchaeota archaeon]
MNRKILSLIVTGALIGLALLFGMVYLTMNTGEPVSPSPESDGSPIALLLLVFNLIIAVGVAFLFIIKRYYK